MSHEKLTLIVAGIAVVAVSLYLLNQSKKNVGGGVVLDPLVPPSIGDSVGYNYTLSGMTGTDIDANGNFINGNAKEISFFGF